MLPDYRYSLDWPVQWGDQDAFGHVNNAVAWAAVEDVIAETGWEPGWAEVEYPRAILPGCEPVLLVGGSVEEPRMWLLDSVGPEGRPPGTPRPGADPGGRPPGTPRPTVLVSAVVRR